jgi:hypothetical protein
MKLNCKMRLSLALAVCLWAVSLKTYSQVSGGKLPATLNTTTWVSDNGNGTFTNQLFYDEFSDPDDVHRYLFADPFAGSLASADAPGARPGRKDGSCFTWEISE